MRNAQEKWRTEEDQWRTTTEPMFNQDSSEQLTTKDSGDALLEARELTLALGTSLEEELTDQKQNEETNDTELLTPSIPEPLTNRPLSAHRLSSIKTTNPTVSSTPFVAKEYKLSKDQADSNDVNVEKSGIAKLQKVLSEVPRKVDPIE